MKIQIALKGIVHYYFHYTRKLNWLNILKLVYLWFSSGPQWHKTRAVYLKEFLPYLEVFIWETCKKYLYISNYIWCHVYVINLLISVVQYYFKVYLFSIYIWTLPTKRYITYYYLLWSVFFHGHNARELQWLRQFLKWHF